MEEGAAWGQALWSALIDVAFACVIGAAALGNTAWATRFLNAMRVSSVALFVALALYLRAGTVAMTDPADGDLSATIWIVLTQTHFGAMILLGSAAGLLLALLAFLPGMRSAGGVRKALFLCALLIFAFSRAATGHAIDKGWFSFALLNHTIHVLAASTWIGVAAVCLMATSRWQSWSSTDRIALTQRVSSVATMALIAVFGTGILNTVRTVDLENISLHSPYTFVLANKLAGVMLAMTFGAYNRWVAMPRMQLYPGSAGQRFSRVLLIETIVLSLVLFAATLLGTMMPPR